jgi:hypothetical protein
MTGLCGCGCGGATSLATRNRRSRGHVKGQPMRFLPRHGVRLRSYSRGHRATPEHRAAISAGLRGKPHSPERRALISGENHYGWKGDSATYDAIHDWLRKHHPKTGVCEECEAEALTEYAYQRHPEPHTRDRSDYREMCVPCHRTFDAALRMARA